MPSGPWPMMWPTFWSHPHQLTAATVILALDPYFHNTDTPAAGAHEGSGPTLVYGDVSTAIQLTLMVKSWRANGRPCPLGVWTSPAVKLLGESTPRHDHSFQCPVRTPYRPAVLTTRVAARVKRGEDEE